MNYRTKELRPFGVLLEALSPKMNIKEVDIQLLKDLFDEHQLVILRGFKTFPSSDDFAHYCDLWGEVSVWPFGKVLELVEEVNPKDHIFDHSSIPLHWDGMFREEIPQYQIFHCVEAPLEGQGGRTTFSNTLLALQNSSLKQKELWSKITGTYYRKMEFYHSRVSSPIITKHPLKEFSVIRYNEPHDGNETFINPSEMEFQGSDSFDFHHSLREALYHPLNFYAHEWIKGDVVIADNFSLLHGREKFTPKAPRHLQRVQVLSNPTIKNKNLESFT